MNTGVFRRVWFGDIINKGKTPCGNAEEYHYNKYFPGEKGGYTGFQPGGKPGLQGRNIFPALSELLRHTPFRQVLFRYMPYRNKLFHGPGKRQTAFLAGSAYSFKKRLSFPLGKMLIGNERIILDNRRVQYCRKRRCSGTVGYLLRGDNILHYHHLST
jgi:hypothetical protein